MKLEFDFHEVVDFCENLGDPHTTETYLMTAVQNVARKLHQNLLQFTPVDTGNLRKMWSAGDNLMFTVNEVGDGYEVTFINTAQNETGYMYGVDVEKGHSTPGGGWVKGRFFVKKSILELENSGQLEQLILTELQKWFGWCASGK